MSVISLPTTLVLTSGKGSALLKPLNDAVETIQTQVQNKFTTFDQKLTAEYTTFGSEVVTNAQSGPQTVSAQLQTMSTSASGAASFVNEYGADINHGAFQLGYLIKAVLKHIPTIIKESVVEALYGGEDKHLLSVQKIYNIASNEKFGEFVTAMSDVVKTYGSKLENLSGEDTSGVLQIFKEIQNEEKKITEFLGKVKTNTEEVKKDKEANNYCGTKIMMHVLIGKTAIEGIKTTIEQLTTALTTLKEKINEILKQSNNQNGAAVNVDELTQKLSSIKDTTGKITDPCPNSTPQS